MRLQAAIDPQANLQLCLTGLDVHIRCADLDGVFEKRLKQSNHRRALGADGHSQFAQVHHRIVRVLLQRTGIAADFFGASVEPVERQGQLLFGHCSHDDRTLEQTADIVKRRKIERIAESHQQGTVLLTQHQRPEPPGGRLRQQMHHGRPEGKRFQINEIDAQLPRQTSRQGLLCQDAGLNQQAANFLAGLSLLLQHLLQLFLRNKSLQKEKSAKPHFIVAASPACVVGRKRNRGVVHEVVPGNSDTNT